MSPNNDILLALDHIRKAIPRRKKLVPSTAGRRIRLGLDRVQRAVPAKQRWLGVHVGGTNGKGSICAFLSGLFKLAGLSYGRYVSPAFPAPHNGVTINGRYVNPGVYEAEMRAVQQRYGALPRAWRFRLDSTDEDHDETLTPFELETATAFRIFNNLAVRYGIVEVGMGGATDATNVMTNKAVTVISKIDLDHREYLGNTVEEIAQVKAGIMRQGVPCIVDHTNSPSVIRVLRRHARSIGTEISLTWKALPLLKTLDTDRWKLEDYQVQNLLCAALAFRHILPMQDVDLNALMATSPFLPGRLEYVKVTALTEGRRQRSVLVDAAHNLPGVEALVAYVDSRLRNGDEPVTWVAAFSSSETKPFAAMIRKLARPQDNFAFVEFAQGSNQPPPVPAELGRDVATTILASENQLYDGGVDVGEAIDWACDKAGEGPLVVTGSLYLLRDLYQLGGIQGRRDVGTMRPGWTQMREYNELQKTRELTPEEQREFKRARRHHRANPVTNPAMRRGPDGAYSTPTEVPEAVRKAQRIAAHHERQATGYRAALDAVERDLPAESVRTGQGESDTVKRLRTEGESLAKRIADHQAKHDEAMQHVRAHSTSNWHKTLGEQSSHEELPPWKRRAASQPAASQPLGDEEDLSMDERPAENRQRGPSEAERFDPDGELPGVYAEVNGEKPPGRTSRF